MAENILENIDIRDVEIDIHTDEHRRATVLGMTNNEYLEFDVIYHPEHDLMIPVHDGTQQIEIPVKEDSQLNEIL